MIKVKAKVKLSLCF